MSGLLMRGWSWTEMVLFQAILMVGILGVGYIVSPYANQKVSEHSGVHYLQWREATPEEELLWRLRQQQELNR